MEIPLWIIAIPLGLLALLCAVFLFFNIFHLARYGIVGRGALMLIVLYIAGFLVIGILGTGMMMTVNWSQTVPLSDIWAPFSSTTGSFSL